MCLSIKRSDFHIHTNISPCASKDATVEVYLNACKKEKVRAIGFSNHLWDENVFPVDKDNFYYSCNMDNVLSLKKQISSRMKGIKVYFGCEVDISYDGTIGLSKESAKKFDYVLIAMSHFHMPFVNGGLDINDAKLMREFSIKRFMLAVNSDFDVPTCIAHPFLPCGVKNLEEQLSEITDEDYYRCFEAAKNKGISIEMSAAFIDKRKEKFSKFDDSGFAFEYVRMMKAAKKSGVKIQLGSDAHVVDNFFVHKEMVRLLKICGFHHKDIISNF